MTEIIRTRNSLAIRWAAGDDLWTVTKSFNLGTRILEGAEIKCSAEIWPIDEGKKARELAQQMDAIFIRPEYFDRVARSEGAPEDSAPIQGMPAWICRPISGKIYVAVTTDEFTLHTGAYWKGYVDGCDGALALCLPEWEDQARSDYSEGYAVARPVKVE